MSYKKKKFLINILTLFPEAFNELIDISVIGNARKKGIWDLQITDIKKFSDKNRNVDDKPYGGGPGMILKPDVLQNAYNFAIDKVKKNISNFEKVMLTPRGERLNQKIVRELSATEGMIIVCGRYEGVDQRFIEYNNLREISLGDFVISGGEPAAVTMIDAVIRLLPNVLGNPVSLLEESFNNNFLEHQQYTKPRIWKNIKVPEILLSGNHKKIKEWRYEKSIMKKKKDR
ncbi:MAG: tRNA (guanine-N(1)-)-methyltransferase [Alphaproteobacteria bacterium MarineAlpha9_Bin4]|nr:tRNA (guanosine(37)-N1)-methyltransferase TrmD [Pelagibacterales bacterium]PPR27062.1 MAG: tRNA (guanine-N(1)-)-methyltransferase [Alphaproteobacteria bacterium MarineAlpha9_Bin4]|tara:strand:- start:1552 stop:2241 length:690 start_codon:yes stop_codon:yes gene_type:complete